MAIEIPQPPPANSIVPDVQLDDCDGQPWQLDQALTRGRVLLIFYRGHW